MTSLGIAPGIAAAAAGATDPPPRPQDIRTPGLYGAVIGADAAKAGGDTLVLMGPHGSGAPLIGTFENAGGGPDWNGWTSVDATAPTVHWQASTYQPVAGDWSAWCGDMTIPPCNPTDPAGGYGFHWDDPDEVAHGSTLPARNRLLFDIRAYFGVASNPIEVGVPDASAFAVTAHPNPFNPATTIRYSVDRPGRLSLQIYDVRGRLVRTLLDGPVTTAGEVRWTGTDAKGRKVASGLYFYEARLHGQVKVGKLTLVQ